MMIIRYFSRLIRLWTTWVFMAIDFLVFGLGIWKPNLSMPPVVYYLIAVLGFVIANIQLYSETETEKDALRFEIEDLKQTRTNLVLTASNGSFIHDAPVLTLEDRYANGLNNMGLPFQVIIGAQIEVHNTGVDEAQLEWEIDLETSDLPMIFQLYSGKTQGHLYDLPDKFCGRRRWVGHWRLECGIYEKDPEEFARQLAGTDTYQFEMKYRTLRAGDPTPWSSVSIEGNFDHYRDSLSKAWMAKGMKDLADLVSVNSAG